MTILNQTLKEYEFPRAFFKRIGRIQELKIRITPVCFGFQATGIFKYMKFLRLLNKVGIELINRSCLSGMKEFKYIAPSDKKEINVPKAKEVFLGF